MIQTSGAQLGTGGRGKGGHRVLSRLSRSRERLEVLDWTGAEHRPRVVRAGVGEPRVRLGAQRRVRAAHLHDRVVF